MNDFFEQIWLDNPVKNYFIVGGTILLILLLKKYISHYLASLLFKFVHKIWNGVDKKPFVNLVIQPLGLFLTILVSIVALHKLNFPARLNAEVYNFSTKELFHAIGTTLFIGSFIWFLLRVIDFIAVILGKKASLSVSQSDNQLVVFFRDFIKVIIGIVGIMMILRFAFSFNVSSFITGLSIVGAAIALALRESLENLIASFIIFFDKPFATGDVVKVNTVTGTVEKIGLRSTRIRTEQKTYVTVPNKQMVDSVLDNLSLRTKYKGELKLELGLKTSTENIKQATEGIERLLMREDVDNTKVFLADITGHHYLLQVEYFTAPVQGDEFNTLSHDINLKILQLLEKLQIDIAGNSTIKAAK
jgi:MscS family membrane protein